MADDFYYQNPRSSQRDIAPLAIKDRNIESLTFDKAQGGTLTLGGANNVNGTFALKNSAGVDKITMDKDGMVVTDGTITIKNSSNTTILDATGLVSTANFTNGNYAATNQITTTSTSLGDISGSSLTFSLSRTANVMFLLSANIGSIDTSGTAGQVQVYVNIDGTDYNPPLILGDASSTGVASFSVTCGTTHVVASLGSGSHTVKLRWKITNGTTTGYIDKRSLTYLVLGS